MIRPGIVEELSGDRDNRRLHRRRDGDGQGALKNAERNTGLADSVGEERSKWPQYLHRGCQPGRDRRLGRGSCCFGDAPAARRQLPGQELEKPSPASSSWQSLNEYSRRRRLAAECRRAPAGGAIYRLVSSRPRFVQSETDGPVHRASAQSEPENAGSGAPSSESPRHWAGRRRSRHFPETVPIQYLAPRPGSACPGNSARTPRPASLAVSGQAGPL